MSEFQFGTKASTLEKLTGQLSFFQIPKLVAVSVGEINEVGITVVAKQLQEQFKTGKIAVRSSAVCEDSVENSAAGQFESVLDVDVNSLETIVSAIRKVVESYNDTNEENQVLFQEFVSDISMSGVVFTRDINNGAPYFVINYDDISGSTNSVTAGDGIYSNRVVYIRHSCFDAIRSERFQILVSAILDLIDVVNSDQIDIEFALSKNLVPYLFQVRPITTSEKWVKSIDDRLNTELDALKSKLSDFETMSQFADSKGLVAFSQMTDWNPAKLLGMCHGH